MPMFVHLTAESRVAVIRRNGIRRLRRAWRDFPGGVFAMPVTRNFYISHQWLRELKRGNAGPIAGVYFRISDDERVWVGHYGQAHRWMTAAEATAEFMSADSREGWEVVIPRRIESSEIHRIRRLHRLSAGDISPVPTVPSLAAVTFASAGSTARSVFGKNTIAADQLVL